jgi:hypothetical protein
MNPKIKHKILKRKKDLKMSDKDTPEVDIENQKRENPIKNKAQVSLVSLFSKIRSKFNLTQAQRIFVAIFLTFFVVGSFAFFVTGSYERFFNKDSQASQSQFLNDPEFQRLLSRLQGISNEASPDALIYDRFKYEDLPIYPSGWVKRNFTQVEQRNALISGPSADPDKDGLSNKSEYLYGSNPKNQYSLCGELKEDDRCKLNDKENVDLGISPLTGVEIEDDREFVVSKQDQVFITSIQDSFEAASAEGVDFPILYQESLKIDLSNELGTVDFLTVPFDRKSAVDYIELRLNILDKFTSQDESQSQLGGLLLVYKTSKLDELSNLEKRYKDLKNELSLAAVPVVYKDSHAAFLMLFDKLVELIQFRAQGVQNNTLQTAEYLEESKKKAVEIIWTYRKMTESLDSLL